MHSSARLRAEGLVVGGGCGWRLKAKSGRGAQGPRTLESLGRTRARPPSPLGLGGQARRDPLDRCSGVSAGLLALRLSSRCIKKAATNAWQKALLMDERLAESITNRRSLEVFHRRPGRVWSRFWFVGLPRCPGGVLVASRFVLPVASCRRPICVYVVWGSRWH